MGRNSRPRCGSLELRLGWTGAGRESIANLEEEGRLPRLFTGLEVPHEVGFALSLKRGGLQGARWIDPDNYHITLRFIGDVDHTTANEVADALDRLSDSEAFSVRLSHLGWFGGDKPRALYAGVDNNVALQRLQAAQERVLQRLGLAPEGRKFVPHVTLAPLRVLGMTVGVLVIEEPPGLRAERRPASHRFAQDVAGSDLRDPERLCKHAALSALAGPRSAKKDQ